MSSMASTAAILSAAGASRRFGGIKALADWRGRSLLAHQVHALLEGGCAPIVVVLGAHAQLLVRELPQDARVVAIWHRAWEQGRVGGLKAGFRALAALGPWPESLLLAAVDQPTESEVVLALRKAWQPKWPVAVPSYQGQCGHPSLWAASQAQALMAIEEATEGLRALMRQLKAQRLEVPVHHPVALNLNRPEDWAAAHDCPKA